MTLPFQQSDILGVVVLMRWLLVGLLISVGALLFLAGAVARHILRQRQSQTDELPGKAPAAKASDSEDTKSTRRD